MHGAQGLADWLLDFGHSLLVAGDWLIRLTGLTELIGLIKLIKLKILIEFIYTLNALYRTWV